MEIPKRYTVAGHDYAVVSPELVHSEGDTIFGQHDSIRCTVEVATSIRDDNGETVCLTETQIANTFWHEVFHSFNYYWNNEQSEELAQVFANFMCEFLRSSNATLTFK